MDLCILYFVIFLAGAAIGSFLNVCIYRIPQELSIVTPRSFCPVCKSPIRAYDNIPIISYLVLGGRCRNCRTRIAWRYPLVEALTGGIALTLYYKFGFSPLFVSLFVFSAALIVIIFIDLDHQIIPDLISLPGIGIGFVLSFIGYLIPIKESIIGILLGGGSLFIVAAVYQTLMKREGMGGGDVKLLAMIGAWLGWKAVLFTLFFASFSGSLIGGAIMLAKKEGGKYAIPFGPFLAFSALAYIFFGEKLIGWYLNWGGF